MRIVMKTNVRRIALFLSASLLLLLQAAAFAAESKSVAPTRRLREDQIVAFHEARTASRPYDADAWRMLSGAYVQRAVVTGDGADYDRGWTMLQKAEDLDPGDPRILQARAELQLSRHHFQNARTLAEQGLAQNPESPDFLAVAGDGALETGDFDAATAYYRHLNKVSPRLTTWARLAHVAEMRGNLEEAADMLQKALDTGYEQGSLPQARAWCRAVLGEIELHRGHADLARKNYELGLKDSPNHLLVLEHFAELEQAEGHFAAAETLYRNILSQREDPKAELRLAAILESRGAKREAATYRSAALRFYQRAVASGNEGYLRPLAVFELSLGHFDRAESLQSRDVTLRPTAESRAVLQLIQDSAAAAGHPLTPPTTNP
jgi:tetratricopeptide (TPR) repeat protein